MNKYIEIDILNETFKMETFFNKVFKKKIGERINNMQQASEPKGYY